MHQEQKDRIGPNSNFEQGPVFSDKMFSLRFLDEDYELEWAFQAIRKSNVQLRCCLAGIGIPTLLQDLYYKKNYDIWQGDFVYRYGSFVLFIILNYIMSNQKGLQQVKDYFEKKASRENLLEQCMTWANSIQINADETKETKMQVK